MKLRNLMYATMIACAFASCSKDDENIPDGGQAAADATLEVNLNITSTKALVGTSGDATINDLTLIVFDATTNVADAVVTTTGTTDKGKGDVSVKTVVPSGQKKVTVLANASDILAAGSFAKGSNISVLEGLTNTLDKESKEGLTMNSGLYAVVLVPGKVNYLGYGAVTGTDAVDLNTQITSGFSSLSKGVMLYRNVAKVSLNEVNFSFADMKDKYPNASFELKNVYILHGKKATKLYSAKEWAATETAANYVNGVTDVAYEGYVSTMNTLLGKDAKFRKIFGYITDKSTQPYSEYVKTTGDLLLTNPITGVTLSEQKLQYATNHTFYVYENTNASEKANEVISTMLVLEGTFTTTGVSETRYYSAAIGRTSTAGIPSEFTAAYGFSGRTTSKTTPDVLRNLQYNITMKIKGMGYTTPFGPDTEDGSENAVLDVQCQVADWGKVAQAPEI